MPTIRFTDNIQRHVACPTETVEGDSVRAALESYFRGNPPARGYVLDDQDRLRRHMVVFIDGRPIRDRDGLGDEAHPDSTIDVMQALSGG